MQMLLSALGSVDGGHAVQDTPWLAYPASQPTHALRAVLGSVPTPHMVHAAPFGETVPGGSTKAHERQPDLLVKGCLPSSHDLHLTPSALNILSPFSIQGVHAL
eukprot:COSAG05_NODE_13304_length_434_cov_85.680597_1_plen_103_part_10